MNITHPGPQNKIEANSSRGAVEVPPNPQDRILFLALRLAGFVEQAAEQGMSLYDLEQTALATVLQIGHAAVEKFLQAQGDGDLGETVVTEEGQTLHRSEQPQPRPLRTVFGQHEFFQYVYAPGPKKKIELRPIEARLNLTEGVCSPLLEDFSQSFCVDQAFGAAQGSLEKVLGQKIPVSLLERVNVQMGQQAEEFMQWLPKVPPEEEGEILVMTGDGKGVPMVKKDRSGGEPETESEPSDFAASSKRPKKQGKKRMATLAGVYSVDPHLRTPEQVLKSLFREKKEEDSAKEPRPKPQHKRLFGSFGCTMEEGTDEEVTLTGTEHAIQQAALEAANRLQEDQPLVLICDGQGSLWSALQMALVACFAVAPRKVVEILDILHVAGYLWKAAKAFYPQDEDQQRHFVRDRLRRILGGEVAGVIRGMRTMSTQRRLSESRAAEVHTACNYFASHQHRMKYDEYLAAGYPIATGVIEGACRHIVKDRLERSGMRWTLAGAQAMLWVRCVYGSGLWEAFQQFRERQTRSRVHPHYGLAASARSSPTATLAA